MVARGRETWMGRWLDGDARAPWIGVIGPPTVALLLACGIGAGWMADGRIAFAVAAGSVAVSAACFVRDGVRLVGVGWRPGILFGRGHDAVRAPGGLALALVPLALLGALVDGFDILADADAMAVVFLGCLLAGCVAVARIGLDFGWGEAEPRSASVLVWLVFFGGWPVMMIWWLVARARFGGTRLLWPGLASALVTMVLWMVGLLQLVA